LEELLVPKSHLPHLKTSEDLTSDMAGNTHTVVFCTKAYATLAENLNAVAAKEKSTHDIFDAFSHRSKAALQVLLCEGGRGDTAGKLVRSNILVRTNYHHVYAFTEEEREKLPRILDSREVALREFMDHFLNYSSLNAGLGIFPALLSLTTEKKFEGLLLHYKKLFHEFDM